MSNNSNWWGRGKSRAITSDPKVVEEAKLLGLEDNEIEDGGGWRNDETKKTHWLRLRQLVEYTKADKRIQIDADFWDWFADYRKTENIGQSRGAVNFGSYSGSSWYSKPKDYLSDWWKGWGYGSASSEDRKLAVALSAAGTTVGVINNSGVKYKVRYARENDGGYQNYTNLNEREVVISPEAVLDKNMEETRGIRITTGLALHEGSHTEYTPAVASVLERPTPLAPVQVSSLLLNILEDLRIERLTGDKFPGFASYFTDIAEWGWEKQQDKAPKVWGPDLKEKLSAVILATKWFDDYESIARADPELSAEFDWWKAWGQSYRVAPDNTTARQLVEDGLARLRQDPKTDKELDNMAKQEAAMRQAKQLSDAEFEQFLKQLREAYGNPAGMEPCPSPDHAHGRPIELTAEQAAEVQKLVDEKLEIHFSQFPDKATGPAPQIIVTKPLETDDSRRAYKIPNRNMVQRIKAAFFFRKRIPSYDERMLKKGQVDDEELWRVGVNDFRVFLQRQVEEQDFVAATMLIDCSGSMHGENIERAQMLASVLLECFSTMPNARVKVRGHAYTGGDTCNVYRIWEPGDPRTRLGLFGYVPSGSNYDGYALEYVAQEMLKDQRPNETKLLIVLSDGRPNGGHRYAGLPAMKHVRWVADHFGNRDIAIVQIAVDPAVQPADQSTMFGNNWIQFDATALPMRLGKLLIRMFGASQ